MSMSENASEPRDRPAVAASPRSSGWAAPSPRSSSPSGVSGTLSGFTASINNTNNTAATGTLLMTETGVVGATGSCYSNGTALGAPDSNAGTCATINKFGGSP